MTVPQTVPPHHLESLQMLRAIAALLVMFFHGTEMMQTAWGYSYLNHLFAAGFSGVDIFFVLSGFIIYYTNTTKPSRPHIFAIKRFVRIYPVYWVVIGLLLIAHQIYPVGNQPYKEDLNVILKAFFLFPQAQGLVHAAWTLSFEIAFYIFFLFFFYFERHFLKLFGGVVLTLGIITLSEPNFFAWSIYPHLFADIFIEFFIGCVVASLYVHQIKHFHRAVFTVGCISFTLVWFSDVAYFFYYPGRSVAFGIPAACIIYGLIYIKLKFPNWLLGIGNASYSTYLIHAPILSVLIRMITHMNLADYATHFIGATGIFIFTTSAGYLFYRCVEKPLLIFCRHALMPQNRPKTDYLHRLK